MSNFNFENIQSLIRENGLDGWLLYDFRGSNEFALEVLQIPKSAHLTRRFFYFIPPKGAPTKIVNAIEAHTLAHLPGEELKYSSYESLKKFLQRILTPGHRIAMEYSPLNSIPYLSKLDAGMFEFLKSFEISIIPSGDLITKFNAVWSEEQYKDNIPVAAALPEIVSKSFEFIKSAILTNRPVTEYDVQQFILSEFENRDLFTDHDPIVGVNENSANPHYSPTREVFKPITTGDFVLIDLWAKTKNADSVWSDITWVGYVGESVPEKYTKIFTIVSEARDAALSMVNRAFAEGREVFGYQLDDAARKVIGDAGFGQYFIHRTGHSITTELHGSGPHLDNFETKDTRTITKSTSFSIEPGIYLTGDFGIRSEIDVFIDPDGNVEVTGGIKQEAIIPILK